MSGEEVRVDHRRRVWDIVIWMCPICVHRNSMYHRSCSKCRYKTYGGYFKEWRDMLKDVHTTTYKEVDNE